MKLTLDDLISKVIMELKRLNYADSTIKCYSLLYKRVITFAKENEKSCFSEELGNDFLKVEYNCTVNYYEEALPKGVKHAIRMIRVLGDYQIHGVLIRRIVKKHGYVKPPQFESILTSYEKECDLNNYSKRGMRTRVQRLFFFIDYLDSRNVHDINDVTPQMISDYVKTVFPHHEKSITAILTTLRMFLRFLYLNEYTKSDLTISVPKQNKYYYPSVPSTWKAEEVRHMLKIIDRGNPTGKRNYAIILLVARLGIRAGDVKKLKLSDFNWNTKSIVFTQEKTKHTTSYPILNDIGWAIIDYLKNARPVSSSPYIFIRMKAPYEAFSKDANLHNIITKYTRLAGISIPKGKRHGLHSLRHSLASGLLAQGTPLPIISEILGHLDAKSTSVYLRTDIEGLRACALDPEEVFLND
ncbi:site-specific integrase [Clostridium tagluense]|uniref:site-specific integrase n=1 Tax=Clostridium tagluense TaxID=360422 RepID=UPI001C6DF174|nr:site-specific integrase [Clostridium tagluense]MBW9154962.1 site-specific integrase [Clostridium tagluense]WLC64415.1 site-specific integrase [Clostridium tagluense]